MHNQPNHYRETIIYRGFEAANNANTRIEQMLGRLCHLSSTVLYTSMHLPRSNDEQPLTITFEPHPLVAHETYGKYVLDTFVAAAFDEHVTGFGLARDIDQPVDPKYLY
jgi:hypothetical protein